MVHGKKRVDRDFVERARTRLIDLARSEPTKGISRKETVTELSDELRMVIEKHGIEAAVAALNSGGIIFPVATVTTYLNQLAQSADVQAMASGQTTSNDTKTKPHAADESETSNRTTPVPTWPSETAIHAKAKTPSNNEKKNDVSRSDHLTTKNNDERIKGELKPRKGSFDIKPDSDDL